MFQKQETTTDHPRFTEQEVRKTIQKLLAKAKTEKSLSQQDKKAWQLLLKNLHKFFDPKETKETERGFQSFERHFASILFPEEQKPQVLSSQRRQFKPNRKHQNQRT